ncbi:hypothetical protein [Aquisphaera insulae]|uniref:hypothetical protein n=1 Tax=Aquisphaera insulae TaxID=2712864 RepID=UPI0013ED7C52|nr:hypothetical protein [Aquisphaera insulae]
MIVRPGCVVRGAGVRGVRRREADEAASLAARPGGRAGRGFTLAIGLAASLVAWGGARGGYGQPPATGQPSQAGGPAEDASALSARYQFRELYSETPGKPGGVLNLYRVASRESITVKQDNPDGAPTVNETSLRSIYTECVAKATKEMADEVVRNYDSATFKTTAPATTPKIPPLEGMRIVYRLRKESSPAILCLTHGRRMSNLEFHQISEQVYLPLLSRMLPRAAARAGDTWPMPLASARALLGAMPDDQEYDLNVELLEVKKADGSALVAVFGIKGLCLVPQGPSGINARVEFTFEPAAPAQRPRPAGLPDATRPAAREGVYEAKGHISKVSLAQDITTEVPDTDGRLKNHVHRVVHLERRLGGGQLVIPNPSPEADVENSWLAFDDPNGRYHLLYPQDLEVLHVNAHGVDFASRQMERQDMLRLRLLEKTGDASKDRLAGDPLQRKKWLEAEWNRNGSKVLPGSVGWLPDANWESIKGKVWRYEAALVPEDAAGGPPVDRIYLDDYIVQFARGETLQLDATTTSPAHTKFRDEVENMIRNFRLGASPNTLPAATRQPRPRP